MNGILSNTAETLYLAPGNLNELVRGHEQCLLEQLTPLVCKHSVTLDMRQVERIDAAGIAALICLYRSAHSAGNNFVVTNASPHVSEILALVGLDGILLSHNAAQKSQSEPCLARNAA